MRVQGNCRRHVFEEAYFCKGSRRFSRGCGKPTQDARKKNRDLMTVNLNACPLVAAQLSGLYWLAGDSEPCIVVHKRLQFWLLKASKRAASFPRVSHSHQQSHMINATHQFLHLRLPQIPNKLQCILIHFIFKATRFA
jgi:hypothetical protein